MSVTTDGKTILGDGTTTTLATGTIATVTNLKNYPGNATLVTVADPKLGGTFCYQSGNVFTSNITFGVSGGNSTLTDSSADYIVAGFRKGQTITLFIPGDIKYSNLTYQIFDVTTNVITLVGNKFIPPIDGSFKSGCKLVFADGANTYPAHTGSAGSWTADGIWTRQGPVAVTDIASLQECSIGKTAFVADANQGGTFIYETGNYFTKGICAFYDHTIAMPDTLLVNQGDAIHVQNSFTTTYNGDYVTSAINGNIINLSAFVTEPHTATITILPLQGEFTFSTVVNTSNSTVTITNSNYTNGFPNSGFLANGFRPNQNIKITGTANYNTTAIPVTINTVTENTITYTLNSTSSRPDENAYATLTNSGSSLQGEFSFSTVVNTSNSTVTISNLTYLTGTPNSGFVTNGFQPNQYIKITGTENYNTTMLVTIDSVSESTITYTLSSTLSRPSEDKYATITNPNTYSGTLSFNNTDGLSSNSVTDTTSNGLNIFSLNQTIVVTGSTYNNGQFKVLNTLATSSSSQLFIMPLFGTALTYEPNPASCSISVVPFQRQLKFDYDSSKVTITMLNSSSYASTGFINNGFYVGQSITISGTTGYNDTFTISDVISDSVIKVAVSISYSSETTDATITDSTTYAPSPSTLTFNNIDSTEPYTLTDTTTVLAGKFHVNQVIQISGTSSNDGKFKVSNTPAVVSGQSKLAIKPYVEVSATMVTNTDGGITFPAIGKNSGRWRRIYDPKGGISVTWFGARRSTDTNVDNTKPIQNAINYAAQNAQNIIQVYIPYGSYRVKQLLIPRGVNLKGEGSMQANGGTRLVQIPDTVNALPNKSMLLFKSFASANGLLYWDGKISDIAFQGDTSSTSGFGICFRTVENYRIALDDMAILDNLFVRDFKSGGIEMPLGAAPAFIMNSKMEHNGGPGISIIKPVSALAEVQSTSFINISGDGNINGLFAIGGYDSTNTFVFVNLKGENSNVNPYSSTAGTIEQQNMFTLTDNCDAMLSIHGACNQPVVNDAGGHRIPIGDLINNDSTSNPIVFWNGVNYRYHALSGYAEPKLLTNSFIKYTQNAGYTGGAFTTDSLLQLNAAGGYTKALATNLVITATIPSDTTYAIITAEQFVKLPVISSDNYNVSLPPASLWPGSPLTIWNQNNTSKKWCFLSGVVDALGISITNLTNQTVYQLISDGANWVKVN